MAQNRGVPLWDLPVRATHGLMVAIFAFQWWSGKTGHLPWHRLAGYVLVGLLTFRLLWGVFGSSTARFAQFVRGPRAVIAYLGKLARPPERAFHLGHNPIGGWSVLLMLGLLIAQVTLGLFSVDTDGLESGPLAAKVSFETGRACAHWHERVFNVLLVVIGLHVVAAFYYLWVRREPLIQAMVTGVRKDRPSADGKMEPAGGPLFLLAAAIGVGVAFWASKGFAI